MTGALIRKLLRDIRLPLLVVSILLMGFQALWAKITQRISVEILPAVTPYMNVKDFLGIIFKGPGQLIQTIMGGETINLLNARDVLSIGYVHPLTQTMLCIWAIGRAAGAITGEIDRGTMELLLAQPVPRSRVVLANLAVDLLIIPVLCLSMWAGTWLGLGAIGGIDLEANAVPGEVHVDPRIFLPGLLNAAALVFAISGYTMWMSAGGRFRGRVLGVAVLVTLLQFLINVVAQLWDAASFLRPFTVFYYYQPQQTILEGRWLLDVAKPLHLGQPVLVSGIAVLFCVGIIGYGMAFRTFSRRDLPAPL